MKFTCEVLINAPRERVVSIFQDPTKLKYYQDGFLKKEPVSGDPGQANAVAEMYYKMGKREMQITETILDNSLPEYFEGYYHHIHMDNTMKCIFTQVSENETLYTSEIEYTAFRGFIPRTMAFLFPSVFKKQVQKWLDNFKSYVENN